MTMDMKRIMRHLVATRRMVGRAFPKGALEAIDRAIKESEAAHRGEIRFAVEGALHIDPLLRGQTARERAIDVFSQLRIWDTEHNNGVLIYLLLAERAIEIVAALRENMILDCLPLWLNNMFHYGRESSLDEVADSLIARLPENIVLVTNEIGMGFIPADPLSRRYGDALGRLNARVAAACDRVILMVAGQPLLIKGESMQALRDTKTESDGNGRFRVEVS